MGCPPHHICLPFLQRLPQPVLPLQRRRRGGGRETPCGWEGYSLPANPITSPFVVVLGECCLHPPSLCHPPTSCPQLYLCQPTCLLPGRVREGGGRKEEPCYLPAGVCMEGGGGGGPGRLPCLPFPSCRSPLFQFCVVFPTCLGLGSPTTLPQALVPMSLLPPLEKGEGETMRATNMGKFKASFLSSHLFSFLFPQIHF